MENLTTSSIVSLFDTTKEQRQSFVTDILTQLNEGNLKPLELHYNLKCMEEIVEKILTDKSYKATVQQDAEHYGKKFMFKNSEVNIKETGVKYDYSICNDEVITILQDELKFAKKRLEEREAFLKALPAIGIPLLMENSGEVITLFPPCKSSTTSVTVTLK